MSLFIHHKSRQAGHRCLHAGRMGGLRPQRSPQNFQVAGDMKHGSGGGGGGGGGVGVLCLDTHGVSQRKQMNKSADGEGKCLDHLHPWQYLQHSLRMGGGTG